MKLPVLIIAGCLFASLNLAAETNSFVVINGAKAHPSRVLAKLKQGGAGGAQARQVGAGYTVRREFKLVAGLLLIETVGQVQAKAGDTPEEAGQRLNAKIEALQATGKYEYVEPDFIRSISVNPPTDAAFVDGTLWGLNNLGQNGGKAGADINVIPAWGNNFIGSTNIIVAVIDTGINYTHRDLATQMWVNPGEIPGNGIDDDGDGYIDNIYGINAITNSGDPRDDDGHGSHVAGTIGAAANDDNGHVGVAWKVQLMACKFLSPNGGVTSDAIQCIDFAVLKGAQISNNSWGGGAYSKALLDSIQAAGDQGHLFLAAAGNNANDNDLSPTYPASYDLDNILVVAALDRNDRIADFSNYGLTSVDIAAPGVEIYSCWIGSDQAYNTIDGTSMACPHVAGAAAILWGAQTASDYGSIKKLLMDGATPIPSLLTNCVTGARLNVLKSLPKGKRDGILEVSVVPTQGSLLRVGTNVSVFVTVSDGFGINNATVMGKFAAFATNVVFRNDGKAPDLQANDSVYASQISTDLSPGSYDLSLSITAPDSQPFATNITYRLVRPPANDNFTNAQKIATGGAIIDTDNRFATREKFEPNHAGTTNNSGSLWYSWSPIANTPVIIDTAGSTFDSVIAVYTGSTLGTLKQVAAANDVGTKQSAFVKFNSTAATTYWIAVAGARSSEVGSVHLRVELNGEPDNTAPLITAVLSPLPGSRIRTVDGKVEISGTAVDPQPNPSGIRQVLIKVNNEIATTAVGTNNWSSTVLLQVGLNVIEVSAYDYAENISIPSQFTLTYLLPSVANDLFAYATSLTSTTGFVIATNTTATKEFKEPNHGGNEGGHSLWYTWTAPANGIFYVSTEGSDIDTLVGIYEGRFVDKLLQLASSDDIPGDDFGEIITTVKTGNKYYIAVDGFAGSTGSVQLNYNFSESQVYKLTASASTENSSSGTVTPTLAYYPINAAVSIVATPSKLSQFKRFKDKLSGTVVSTANPYTFIINGPVNLIAEFEPRVYTENFESGVFNELWSNNNWEIQTTSTSVGTYAARSKAIADGGSSSMILTSYTRSGVGSFDYFVNSEEFFDKLEFRINGQLIEKWSGLSMGTTFQTYTFDVPNGYNTFQWSYSKDNALAVGLDAAFVDAIQLPAGSPSLNVEITPSGGYTIKVKGQPLGQVTVQISTDLKTWRSGTILVNDIKGQSTWKVPTEQGNSGAFYRLMHNR